MQHCIKGVTPLYREQNYKYSEEKYYSSVTKSMFSENPRKNYHNEESHHKPRQEDSHRHPDQ
jgi:hypothetical protein